MINLQRESNKTDIIQKYNKKAFVILPARVEKNFRREIFNIDKHLKSMIEKGFRKLSVGSLDMKLINEVA